MDKLLRNVVELIIEDFPQDKKNRINNLLDNYETVQELKDSQDMTELKNISNEFKNKAIEGVIL